MIAENREKKVLITGAAGFVGTYLSRALLEDPDYEVIGIDNLNDYYDMTLKKKRLELLASDNFRFIKGDITDRRLLVKVFEQYRPKVVINMAAQAGVRYSMIKPEKYIDTNIVGFSNILDMCRLFDVDYLVFASSSSVYGDSEKYPSSEYDHVDAPVSVYAATKRCDEILAYAYSKAFGIPIIGLRFFTVYGPYGRPDMAYYKFAEKMISGEPIELFNYGQCNRDFTYIDDIVNGILLVIENGTAYLKNKIIPYDVFNIGKGKPDKLMGFVRMLKDGLIRHGLLGKDYDLNKHIVLAPMQKGDVITTYADNRAFEKVFGYCPETELAEGLDKFCKWFAEYYNEL